MKETIFTMKDMLVVVTVMVFWVVGVALVAQSTEYFSVQPPSGAIPPAVIINSNTPANAQICAATSSALVSCRSVGDFRQWAVDRQPMSNIQRSK